MRSEPASSCSLSCRTSWPSSPRRRSVPASSPRNAAAPSVACAPRASAFCSLSLQASIFWFPARSFSVRPRISSSKARFRSAKLENCSPRFCLARSCSRRALATCRRCSMSRAWASASSTCGRSPAISALAVARASRARAISARRAAPWSSLSRWRRDVSSASKRIFDKASNKRSRSDSKAPKRSATRFCSSSRRCRSASASAPCWRLAPT
mmetsp:Transcript_42684/g.90956  ORF Transcript_42684/g.90956 Transcript_42684/m.90956 type:complete len:211 (-) Transcript_42684:883-1515(-)